MTWIRPAGGTRAERPCTLVVCRGCCCGDPRKNPGTDHAGQLARLHDAAAASGGRLAVRTVDCLGPCAQANIVVVQPTTEARRRGARATWFGWVLDDTAADEIAAWAAAGGPGTPLPATLELHRIAPPADRPKPDRAPRDRPRKRTGRRA
ncbi:(2Fe-2S) ferredoxin domain-containing protein [Streptomyces antimicrobicus]|uniref:(2Fe-2S) ferredoxin domain-containing protein n=1 Tax=Streptomyces antimicrobicus TaxID=2883108 RepID=A0ABS8BEC5_9ACTN|nr:(2Fe-2S) ferredoxin domain-containing protein [Streptomyces antimicrobicus]MCB5182947.1 (2Fe-2S) ferredoxin domain-containing protein [Streptomyces antimicrobicus]